MHRNYLKKYTFDGDSKDHLNAENLNNFCYEIQQTAFTNGVKVIDDNEQVSDMIKSMLFCEQTPAQTITCTMDGNPDTEVKVDALNAVVPTTISHAATH